LNEFLQAINVFLQQDLTLILLFASIGIFGYLAARSRNVRTFQFQISIFILIWIAGELANVFLETGIIVVPASLQEIGYELHVASMVFFAVFIYARYVYAYRRRREIIEDLTTQQNIGDS
jgi:membrane associated rhomboid family serine protease